MAIELEDLPVLVVEALRDYDFVAARSELVCANLDAVTSGRYDKFVRALELHFETHIKKLGEKLRQIPNPDAPPVILLVNPDVQLLPPVDLSHAA